MLKKHVDIVYVILVILFYYIKRNLTANDFFSMGGLIILSSNGGTRPNGGSSSKMGDLKPRGHHDLQDVSFLLNKHFQSPEEVKNRLSLLFSKCVSLSLFWLDERGTQMHELSMKIKTQNLCFDFLEKIGHIA